ncbi:MAG: hypothetical protein M3P41_13735, partial [Actinomycetota bacterium]|nr:hypothetical protein [Actinomycetota bacterium]
PSPFRYQVRRCEEPTVPSPLLGEDGTTIHDGVRLPDYVPGEPFSIWQLHARAIEATNALWRDKPSVIIWHFQLSLDGSSCPLTRAKFTNGIRPAHARFVVSSS